MPVRIEVLWIDLGGVVFRDPRPIVVRRLCARTPLDPRRLGPAYYRLSRALDRDTIDLRSMHDRLRREFGISMGYRDFHQLVTRTSLVPVRPVLSALRRLRASGSVRILITSNVSREIWLGLQRRFSIRDLAHDAVLSFRVRTLKPSASFLREAIRRSGAPPARVLFLDDAVANIVAARRAGVHAHRVSGPRDVLGWFRRLSVAGGRRGRPSRRPRSTPVRPRHTGPRARDRRRRRSGTAAAS